MIFVHFQGKPFIITVIQVYAPTTNAEEAEVEWFYEDLIRPSRINTPKRCYFYHRRLERKSRKSKDTWNNRQVIGLGNTKWSRAKTNRVLSREHTGHSKYSFPTTQEMTLHMEITKWEILQSDWLYSLQPKMEKLCTVCQNKIGSWLWLRSWTSYFQNQT